MCRRREAAHISLPAMLRQLPPGGEQAQRAQQAQCWDARAALAAASSGEAASCGEAAGPCESAAASRGVLGSVQEEEEGEEGEGSYEAALAPAAAAAAGAGGVGVDTGGQPTSATAERQQSVQGPGAAAAAAAAAATAGGGGEGRGGEGGPGGGGAGSEGGAWVWRTPLLRSRLYWDGWYRGLSDTFLSLKVPKVGYSMGVSMAECVCRDIKPRRDREKGSRGIVQRCRVNCTLAPGSAYAALPAFNDLPCCQTGTARMAAAWDYASCL